MTKSTVCCQSFAPWTPAVLGLVAFLAVATTLDVADDVSWSTDGPGLTFDEGLNVEGGVFLSESIIRSGLAAVHPAMWHDIFNAPGAAHDYPPLGRLVLGLSNAALMRAGGPRDRGLYVISYARVGSALAYALLILLIARFAQQRMGACAGLVAGLSLLLTPRLFAHAHIASIETMMNLTYAGSVIVLCQTCADRAPLRARDGLLPGLFLGLAFLTKIQAIFLPLVIVIWMLWNWRLRGILPLLVLGLTAITVFVAGWPWLWSDPIGRGLDYFAQSTNRAVLYCYYLGHRYADREVPWHYPFVMFAVTTPAVWLLLGLLGVFAGPKRQQASNSIAAKSPSAPRLGIREYQLLLGAFLLPLLVFAIPGVTVYDGDRLFLVVWPIFAVFVGAGAQRVADWLNSGITREGEAAEPPLVSGQNPAPQRRLEANSRRWSRRVVLAIFTLLVAIPLVNTITLHPCQLSYYNELVGGLRGASALGFEPTYWGDSATPALLRETSKQIPQGARLAVAPVLHPLVLEFMRNSSWLRNRPDIVLEAYDQQNLNVSKYVLVIRRHADSWPSLSPAPDGTKVLGSVERSGVNLANVLQLP